MQEECGSLQRQRCVRSAIQRMMGLSLIDLLHRCFSQELYLIYRSGGSSAADRYDVAPKDGAFTQRADVRAAGLSSPLGNDDEMRSAQREGPGVDITKRREDDEA